ncbi:unnamed protein product [[Candida] boidinii]|uniref:Protein ARV n=1 Tax=Candida boidinii TaxID=5477 RepID=A0A9W6WH67_CANBO|nr:unnamed protein product [[Candida] boidinii]GMG09642.1 unnamed protein product [[Candida] boidinii]
MICVECGCPIRTLYDKYKGDYIKLTVCEECHKVADIYVEYDKVLLFIDLMLLKPQAYRHAVYNRLVSPPENVPEELGKREGIVMDASHNDSNKNDFSENDSSFKYITLIFRRYSSSLRLLLLMILFEVYLTWAHEEKNYFELNSKASPIGYSSTSMMTKLILDHPVIMYQYSFFLFKAIVEILVFNIVSQTLVYKFTGFGRPQTVTFRYPAPIIANPSGPSSPKTTSLRSGDQNNNDANKRLNGHGDYGYNNLDSEMKNRMTGDKENSDIDENDLNGSSDSSNVAHLQISESPTTLNGSFVSEETINPTTVPLSRTSSNTSVFSINVIEREIHYPSEYFIAVLSTSILLSNIIKLFPIIMLIWPYDNTLILNSTKAIIQIIHVIVLIETLHTVIPQDQLQLNSVIENENNSVSIDGRISNSSKNQESLSLYWIITIIVIIGNLFKFFVTYACLAFVVSHFSKVSFMDLFINECTTSLKKLNVFYELSKMS